MRTPIRLFAAFALGVLLLATPVAHAATPAGASRTVVVVLAPYVTWTDIVGGSMPATRALAEESAVGNINIRSSVRLTTRSGLTLPQTQIALTMSAGSPAAFDLQALAAYTASRRLESGTAAEIYRRTMGRDSGLAEIVYLGLPRILRANESETRATIPGALGQAIVDAGGTTAAIGNSDGGHIDGREAVHRPAALLAMDAAGRVRYGDVSGSLLMQDPGSPYGLSTDFDALGAVYGDVMRRMAAAGGPALVVIDPGDPERAYNFTADAAPSVAEAHRLAAAGTIDDVVAMVRKTLPEDAALVVVSTGQARPTLGPSGFGPVILSAPEFRGGTVYSPSTHREGLMTDLDVSATVLSMLGIDAPVDIVGNAPIARDAAPDLGARVERLLRLNATAVAVDTLRPSVQNTYITLSVILLLGCAALLRPMQRSYNQWGRRAASAFSKVILLLLCIPVASTLTYLFVRLPGSAAALAALFAVTTLVVWGVALLLDARWGSTAALAFAGLSSAGVLLLDQVFGAPLSFSGMFSYSPLLGARYYGLGNEGASIVVGGALAGFAMLLETFADRPWVRRIRLVGPPVLGLLVIVISAAPFLGANVGVVAWGTVAFGIAWTQLAGKPITWKTFLAMGLVVGVAIAAFSAYDLLLGAPEGQTHLGRAWASAESGGLSQLWMIVARKAETNWRVLRATNWSILMVAILAFLGFMRWRPHGVFAETLKAYPAFAIAMTAALWGSVVGYFTEDSGIVIPALVMLYITGSLLHVMLSRIGIEAKRVSR